VLAFLQGQIRHNPGFNVLAKVHGGMKISGVL